MLCLVTEQRPSILVLPQKKKFMELSTQFQILITDKKKKKKKKITFQFWKKLKLFFFNRNNHILTEEALFRGWISNTKVD